MHGDGDFAQFFNVFLGSPSLGDFFQQQQHLFAADPAGGAFAAGFVDREIKVEFGDVDHVGGFVHHDHAARPHDGADFFQFFIANRQADVGCRDHAARRTAGLNGFQFFAVRYAAADFVDDGVDGGAHRHFDQAGMLNLSGEGENLGAFGGFGAEGRKPVGAF